MSETWYRTGGWGHLIEEVQVVKSTEKSVIVLEKRWMIGGRDQEYQKVRHAKRSEYSAYFPTWEEAHAYLLDKAEREVNGARLRLNDATGRLGNIKGLKKP